MNIADRIGQLRADIKTLSDELKELEASIKFQGLDVVEGDLFRVTVSYNMVRSTTDWKKIAARFEPSRQLIAANTRETVYDRLSVSAHTKGV